MRKSTSPQLLVVLSQFVSSSPAANRESHALSFAFKHTLNRMIKKTFTRHYVENKTFLAKKSLPHSRHERDRVSQPTLKTVRLSVHNHTSQV